MTTTGVGLAIELSRGYDADQRRWPFDAVLAAGRLPARHRSMQEDAAGEDLRREAVMAVRGWTRRPG